MTLPEIQKVNFTLDENSRSLYDEVQHSNLFSDSKTFSDAIAKSPFDQIAEKYHRKKTQPNFKLKHFIDENFILPAEQITGYQSDLTKPIDRHLEDLWDVLTRQPEKAEDTGTLIPLPFR
jgi:alpha,alpha-trehalase